MAKKVTSKKNVPSIKTSPLVEEVKKAPDVLGNGHVDNKEGGKSKKVSDNTDDLAVKDLPKELVAEAATYGDQEARSLVGIYYDIQKIRVAARPSEDSRSTPKPDHSVSGASKSWASVM
jgi:hypothetical protein